MTTTHQTKRLPSNYQLVYDVVRAQAPGVHAPAGDIYARARALKATLGYSTVYRALDRLCRMGLVLELHLPGMSAALYEQARSGHAHFVCRACGRIEDVDCDVPADAIHSFVKGRDGEVEEIILTVHGRCMSCRQASPPAAESAEGQHRPELS
ncbi:Fur family transcriptional regulator [Lichenibacterium ramalinae]|uniref:Ferric uptake regulation protein n=1 Tax=Lichenibacterium ramalinae TaxID=2316527 RepID=A0A4Q2RAN9_9HYPH|nr:transcriptional repressor [Lichenibacterium ramalinae]RYB03223.1 transcriptional repressor [Lichenibacterium ramalinae]